MTRRERKEHHNHHWHCAEAGFNSSVITQSKVCTSQVPTKSMTGPAEEKCFLHDSPQKGFSHPPYSKHYQLILLTNKFTLPKVEAKSKKEF